MSSEKSTKPDEGQGDEIGHYAHTQTADSQKGLDGQMRKRIKVTMMGAGSGFTPRLVSDVAQIIGSEPGEFALVDTDKERLEIMVKYIDVVLKRIGKTEWKVKASTNRREVMKDSDYIVNCIEVAGRECVGLDYDIPMEFGVDQVIGDTIGPSGLFKGLRTIPVWLELLKDAEELCPEALVLNYTNPMNMMTLAAGRASKMQVVGLCHSVQGTSHLLAKRAGVEYSEMTWNCAGINHLAWFTRLEHKGKDLYPLLMEKARQDIAGNPSNKDDADDLIRKDMMLHFGAFITESSGHLSEYVPYYRTDKATMEKYLGPGGMSGYYPSQFPKWREEVDGTRLKIISGEKSIDEVRKKGWDRSWEYASWIIEAHQKDTPFRIYGNVLNKQGSAGPLIGNLPHDGCVEVACMIDQNGITPTAYGDLPPQMAAICRSNMSMFDLAAQAAIEKSKELAIYATMLDPLTAAACSPAQIKEMVLKLFKEQEQYLPGFK